MAHPALVVFTARPIEAILHDGGSGDWRLDAERARHCEFLVCTQNRHNPDFGAPTAPHRAAFLIGRIAAVVPALGMPGRWRVEIADYVDQIIPNIWGKSGHLRYPVRYTTLEELGIDLASLPPFRPLPMAGADGLSEMAARSLIVPPAWTPRLARLEPARDDPDAWRRLDAILAQLDRVPDLPGATDPLDWDERGLPR